MMNVYHYDAIDSQTTVLGVIADPIGHSLSPLVHNTALRQAGLNAVYVPFRVPAEHLDSFLADAPLWGIRGLSVTIPHKEAVLKKLSKFDPAVKGIGAANTLVWEKDDLIGFNTDFRAAMDSLERAVEASSLKTLDKKTALILGAGGAARAMAFGLKKEAADVVISSRTLKRAQQLAHSIGCEAIDWSNRYGISPDIVINCSPIGMHPNVDETPYDRTHMRNSMVVFDMVYNPLETELLKRAKEQHLEVIPGIEMFVEQAAHQFELWTGESAPRALMQRTVTEALS